MTTARDWYEDHENLAELWDWLEDRCEQPDDPAGFMREPWSWEPEYNQMQAEKAAVA